MVGCETGRVGFWKFLPDPLELGSRRVRTLGELFPLGSGRVKPENPTEFIGAKSLINLI